MAKKGTPAPGWHPRARGKRSKQGHYKKVSA